MKNNDNYLIEKKEINKYNELTEKTYKKEWRLTKLIKNYASISDINNIEKKAYSTVIKWQNLMKNEDNFINETKKEKKKDEIIYYGENEIGILRIISNFLINF